MFAKGCILLISFSGLKLSCNKLEKQPAVDLIPVARVYDQYLYKQELEKIVPIGSNPTDSVEVLRKYAYNWVIEHLLASEASAIPSENNMDIEKKVSDYRFALLAHAHLEQIVSSQLNKEITEEEIQNYYQTHQENFKLKHSIVRGKFIIVPKIAPNSISLKNLIISKNDADVISLKEYCENFAEEFSLDENIWLKWEDIVTKTPFRRVPDKTRLLKKTSFTEIQDETYRYYLKIEAYKTIDDISPIQLVREHIKSMVLYKRRIALIKQIKENMLQQAKSNNDYTLYD